MTRLASGPASQGAGLLLGLDDHVHDHVVLLNQFFFLSLRETLDFAFDSERKTPAPDLLLKYEL